MHNYDTIYQERYVGLPSTDSAAYRDASALYFADGLRGDLLVVHGSGDDNVHYQGTEQLINALVAANKPFSMMEYPNRTHGIFEGPGNARAPVQPADAIPQRARRLVGYERMRRLEARVEAATPHLHRDRKLVAIQ